MNFTNKPEKKRVHTGTLKKAKKKKKKNMKGISKYGKTKIVWIRQRFKVNGCQFQNHVGISINKINDSMSKIAQRSSYGTLSKASQSPRV